MSQVDEMLVVREQENLRLVREARDASQGCRGATVVKIDQDVVDDERHRLAIGQMPLNAGQSKSQEELVSGAIR